MRSRRLKWVALVTGGVAVLGASIPSTVLLSSASVPDHRSAAVAPTRNSTTSTDPTSTTSTTTTSLPATTTTVPAAAGVVPVPPEGHATAWGCGPALAYLHAYGDPRFTMECPGPPDGHQATTCYGGSSGGYPCAPYQYLVDIEDPCPAAYMNEASNSWVLDGKSDAPIDPYGHC